MKHALLLPLIFLIGCSAAKPEAPKFDKAAMDNLLSDAVSSGEIIGASALIYDEGKTVYTGTFGLRDREREQPVEMDTVWRIYSMTKPIMATVIMDLIEEGKLNLEDPVAKYIPELGNMKVASPDEDGKPTYAPQAVPMTIEDLLLHRAGLGYGIFGDVNPIETAYGKAGLFEPSEDLSVKMKKLSKLPLLAQPGDGWYYSYSMDVLGRVAEVVTKQKLGDIMKERIFAPLGMNETSFRVQADQRDRFATNYFKRDDGSYIVEDDGQKSPFLNDNAFQSGGGGLVGTLGDYAKFSQMLLDGGIYKGKRILEEATVKMMMTNQMDDDDKFMMPWLGGETGSGFGYGGSVQISNTTEQLAKNGKNKGQFAWGGAARTIFWIDDTSNAYGVLMLQFFGQPDPDIHDRFQALAYKETANTP